MPNPGTNGAGVAPAFGGLALTGVAIAEVINNLDDSNLGRVQLRLPWLPGVEPWARVAAASGGPERGSYFIPQVGEEVLVAFQHGDIRDAFVLGCLWNGTDKPPSQSRLDPVNRRVIKTPAGHVIELDDAKQSIVITTATKQTISLDPDKIKVATANETAKVVLETSGSVSIEAQVQISLKAATIQIAATTVEMKGDASAKMSAGGVCEIQGGLVKIN